MKSLTSILFGLWLLETVQSIFWIEKMVHVYLYNWNSMFNVRNWRSAKNAASLLWLFEWEQFCSSNNNNSVNTVHDFRMLSEARQSCNYDTHLCTCSVRILISPGLVIPDNSDRRKSINQSINQSQAQPGSAGKKPQNCFVCVCVCAISGFPNLTVHINQLSDY